MSATEIIPKTHDVWKTREGRIVLIVEVHWETDKREVTTPQLGMLWYDEIDKTFTVSELMNRLESRLDMTMTEWFNQAALKPKAESFWKDPKYCEMDKQTIYKRG